MDKWIFFVLDGCAEIICILDYRWKVQLYRWFYDKSLFGINKLTILVACDLPLYLAQIEEGWLSEYNWTSYNYTSRPVAQVLTAPDCGPLVRFPPGALGAEMSHFPDGFSWHVEGGDEIGLFVDFYVTESVYSLHYWIYHL